MDCKDNAYQLVPPRWFNGQIKIIGEWIISKHNRRKAMLVLGPNTSVLCDSYDAE